MVPALGVAATSTLVSHGINKSLNKKKRTGGSININLKQSDINKINNILKNLPIEIKNKYSKINSQNGSGLFSSLLIPSIGSMIINLW